MIINLITFLVLNVVSLTLCRRYIDETPDLRGIFAPVFTPLNYHGKLNLNIIPEYTQFLADNEIPGIIIASNLGEGSKLTVKEEKELITAWIRACKPRNIEVMVEIGSRPLLDNQELAKYAERAGANSITVGPDLSIKPTTVGELVYYMECIAQVAPKTPLLYFDFPQSTGVNVDMVNFTVKATQKIPTYVGLKAENFDNALRVQPLLKPYQRIILADSLYLAPGLLMGFDGFITAESNLFPQKILNIVDNARMCKLEEAREQYHELLEISKAIGSLGSLKPAFKAAMSLVTGLEVGPVRAPDVSLDETQKQKLKNKLEQKGIYIVN